MLTPEVVVPVAVIVTGYFPAGTLMFPSSAPGVPAAPLHPATERSATVKTATSRADQRLRRLRGRPKSSKPATATPEPASAHGLGSGVLCAVPEAERRFTFPDLNRPVLAL